MIRRSRTEILAGLLLSIAIVCGTVAAMGIERHLVVAVQTAIGAAEISPLDIAFDGRDAVLRGRTDSRARSRLAEQVAASVPGVRTAHSALIVSAPTLPPAPSGAASELRMIRLGEALFLSGTLPDAAARDALFAIAADLFGEGSVHGRVALDPDARVPGWLGQVGDLARMAAVVLRGGISVQSGAASVWGTVATAADADRVREVTQRAFPDVEWRLDLAFAPAPRPQDD